MFWAKILFLIIFLKLNDLKDNKKTEMSTENNKYVDI